jgi:ABC-type transport system involved in multi-copper enzyme maturation permease subunit
MSWLIWRQHRLQAVVVLLSLAALTLLMLPTGLRMHDALTANGLGECVSGAGFADPRCIELDQAFSDRFSSFELLSVAFLFVPLFVGMFLGAPLVAREVEHGTHRLVWTQGVTRLRWALGKIAFVTAAAAAVGICFALLLTWWIEPLNVVNGSRLDPGFFDMQGTVPVAYALFAVALGVLASTYTRSVLAALALTAGAFIVARIVVLFWARAHYLPPVRRTEQVLGGGQLAPTDGWVLSERLFDASGNEISGGLSFCPPGDATCADKFGPGSPLEGAYNVVEYHPADRFWTFQLIESGIFMGAALLLFALAVYRIRRRLS